MVIGDKNMEDYVGLRTGRRSLGPSPSGNGHISDDSSASDDSDSETGMRVGTEYQAFIPICNPGMKLSPRAEAMLVWAPHPEQTEAKIDEYISISKEKHGYNTEQALGMLFWHKHKIDKALADLPNFTPFPDEWTVEDKVLYEQAFSFHGKSFHRIRQMLPDKSIAQLVKYYYSWKKTRTRTSLMDRQARKLANHHGDSDNEAVGSGNSDSDIETGRDLKEEIRHTYLRPAPGAKKTDPHGRARNRRRPPRGMYINHDDLHAIATGPPGQGDAILKQLDAELVTLKRQVQNNKQLLSMYKQKTHSGIDSYRPPEPPNRINARWTNEELLLAVQGVRKYGKDFKAISEVIGNKTEAHLRSFFVNYRRRYNLDEILAEYEVECGTTDTHKDEPNEKMEIDLVEEDTAKPNASPEENSTAQNGTASAPPPLVKQAPTLLQSPLRQPPPLQQQAPRSTGAPVTTAPSRSVLQQPPPLIRPNSNSVPIMSRLKPTVATSTPQLANRD